MLIHRYWTGPDAPNIQHYTDDDLPIELVSWLDDRMRLATHRPLHHRSNMVRWWLLYEHGGVWLDCDIPTPETIPEFPFALWSRKPDRFRVGAMGFEAGHIIPSLALTYLNLTNRVESSIVVSGSELLRRLIRETDTAMNKFVLDTATPVHIR